MIQDFAQHEAMKQDIEKILKKNKLFGPLHQIALSPDEDLMFRWSNPELRPKARAHQAAYVSFMEEIADCLLDYGYCLEADVDATEAERNDFMWIVPDEGQEEDLWDVE